MAQSSSPGVCYGMLADGLPSQTDVVTLCKDKGIERVRLQEPNHEALEAFSNTNIEIILGVPNTDLKSLSDGANAYTNAIQWVQNNVKMHSNVNFRYIVVGDGVSPLDKTTARYAPYVIGAMVFLRSVIESDPTLKNQIIVSTAIDSSAGPGGVLVKWTNPSQGSFEPNTVKPFLQPIITFLARNGAPLLVNVHPYLYYTDGSVPPPYNRNLDYPLFRSDVVIISDGELMYKNLFDAIVDAVYWAIEGTNVQDATSLKIAVSATGWPTAGTSGTTGNASTYNRNLIKYVKEGNGTPKRSNIPIEAYIFSLFDETKRAGKIYDKHWGIYDSDGTEKYELKFK